MAKTTLKSSSRIRRHKRIRAKIQGTEIRPRLAVFRSNRFVSVQLINDDAGKTIAQAHGREFPGSLGTQSKAVGKAIAERAKSAGIDTVVFDRGGYSYAAMIKSLADTAREGGLKF